MSLPKSASAYVRAYRAELEPRGVKIELEYRSRRHAMLRCIAPSGDVRCKPVSTSARCGDDAQMIYLAKKDARHMAQLLALPAAL